MDPKETFSSKAEIYNKYRWRHPEEIIVLLTSEINLQSSPTFRIADIGSGTGILSELFLKNHNTVIGVEPNKEMREVAERVLKKYPHFVSVNGTAEATSIRETVDAITAGMSFNYFDLDKAREEFLRILKPNGYVIIIWTPGKSSSTPLGISIQQLLDEYRVEKNSIIEGDWDVELAKFYGPNRFDKRMIKKEQYVSHEVFQGRFVSISGMPNPGDSKYSEMAKKIDHLFSRYQVDGYIRSEIITEVYYGRLS
ncbi:MAG: class I SAM-dependent methyltransferase [Promethearchaeota archaeon]